MIIKSFEIKKNKSNFLKFNLFLLYGENIGLKKDISKIIKNEICGDNPILLDNFGTLNKDVIYHGHCHQKSLVGANVFNSIHIAKIK